MRLDSSGFATSPYTSSVGRPANALATAISASSSRGPDVWATRWISASTLSLAVPLHLRNAPTNLMKELGYGKGYRYPHDFPDYHVEENYLPEELKGRIYYRPTNQGYEGEIRKRLEKWRKGKG